MSTVNYYQASLSSTFAQPANEPLEIGLEFQPVMKGARLGYGAAVFLLLGLLTSFLGVVILSSNVILLIAATVQTFGLLHLRKAPAASSATPLLNVACLVFGAGTLCMLLTVVMLQVEASVFVDYMCMISVLLWGMGDGILLLGLCRLGKSVNQPRVASNAKLALFMLGISYALLISLFLLLLNPSLLVSMNLATNQESLVRFLQSSINIIWIPVAIGLVFYIRTVSPLTRLAEWQVAQRSRQTNFAELGEIKLAARGKEMDFLTM